MNNDGITYNMTLALKLRKQKDNLSRDGLVKYVNDLLDRSGLHEMYIRTLKDPTDNIPYSEEEYGLDGAQILDLAVFLCMTFTIQTGHIIPDCVEMIKNVLCDPEEGFIYNYF